MSLKKWYSPVRFGLPYHGLARRATDAPTANAILTLPNDDQLVVPAARGTSLVLRSPTAPGYELDDDELAQAESRGQEWRDYALLTRDGFDFIQPRVWTIGGQPLGAPIGPQPDNWRRLRWIYCDPAGSSWLVYVEIVQAPGTTDRLYQGSLILEKVFGRFGPIDYQPIERTLAVDDVLVQWPTGTNPWPFLNYQPGDSSLYRQYFWGPFFNTDGSESISNIYGGEDFTGSKIAQWIFGDTENADPYTPRKFGLMAQAYATLSGTGSLDPETLGDGITGTLSLFLDPDKSYSATSVNIPTQTSDWTVSGTEIDIFVTQANPQVVQEVSWSCRIGSYFDGNVRKDVTVERTVLGDPIGYTKSTVTGGATYDCSSEVFDWVTWTDATWLYEQVGPTGSWSVKINGVSVAGDSFTSQRNTWGNPPGGDAFDNYARTCVAGIPTGGRISRSESPAYAQLISAIATGKDLNSIILREIWWPLFIIDEQRIISRWTDYTETGDENNYYYAYGPEVFNHLVWSSIKVSIPEADWGTTYTMEDFRVAYNPETDTLVYDNTGDKIGFY